MTPLTHSLNPTDLFVWGMLAHLVADWLFQGKWIAENKQSPAHPAAWVHALIHLMAVSLVFTPVLAVIVAGVHLLIDTRVPLRWWNRVIPGTTEGAIGIDVMIWRDQVLHLAVLALAAVAQAKGLF